MPAGIVRYLLINRSMKMKKFFRQKETPVLRNKNISFIAAIVFLAQIFFTQCGTTSNRGEIVINTNNVRDYICIVNRYLHPNIDRYLKSILVNAMTEGNNEMDKFAQNLEGIRRGGFGSGFVYVDSNGNNYIITNYHVIAGAYRLSVKFERENGESFSFYNLSVLNANENEDIAILAFPNNQRPFRKGFGLSSSPIRSGTQVHAAGYPGMFNIPVWSFSTGNVSNPHISPPGMESYYVQHNADINPGNSGGPLLVGDKSNPLGYSVVGINTFYISQRQGSNFSITNETIRTFLNKSFEQVDERTALENRINAFMDLLIISSNGFVYEKLFDFLSNPMIARDPEGAANGMFEGSNANSQQANKIVSKIIDDTFYGIGLAVAYKQIEMYVFNKNTNVQPELLSIIPNNFGGYTAKFLISGYPYRTEWVRDYGTWKLDDFYEDDGEYNDFYLFATEHPLGKRVIYSLASGLDHDWYVLDIPASGRLTIRTEGRIDPRLDVYYDPATQDSMQRTLIGDNDDYGNSLNARVTADVRAGRVYVRVRNAASQSGEYTLIAEM